jgi:hypothetical protein
MDDHVLLKVCLQHHLATDTAAVKNLPHLLKIITSESLAVSAHQHKWIARVNVLLHAKGSDARWAGLCLALHTAQLSRPLFLENAQSWIGFALPILSVRVILMDGCAR